MHLRRLPLLVGLVIAGCSKPDASQQTPGASPSAAAAGLAPAPAVASVGAGASAGGTSSLDCDKLFPSAVRGSFLADVAIKTKVTPNGRSATCTLEDKKEPMRSVNVNYECGKPVDEVGMNAALAALRGMGKPPGKDVPNLGRAAVEVKALGAEEQIHIFDDKTPCKVIIGFGLQPPPNMVEIARAALAGTTSLAK